MNIYVMQDRVSGQFGQIFEAQNDSVVRRDFRQIAENYNIPGHLVADTVIFLLGSFNQDADHPAIFCNTLPKIILRGDDPEYVEIRKAVVSAPHCDTLPESI